MRSPVAAFESESPSVRRKDVENAIFLDPLLYPKIVFYRMVSMFLPFFGHIHSDGFDCEPFANTEWPFDYSIIFQRLMNSSDMLKAVAALAGAS